MPPRPNTATVAPGSTFVVNEDRADARGDAAAEQQTLSSGASLRIFATAISGTTVYSENVELPM